MTAGRPRTPSALREVTGARTRAHHAQNEPKPAVRAPDKPAWLMDDPVANGLYDEVTAYIVGMRVGTEVDGIALGLLADQLAVYIELREQVRREGAIIELEGASGQLKRVAHPAMPLMKEASTLVIKLLREYGLTAASRTNINAEPEKEVSSFDDFMSL